MEEKDGDVLQKLKELEKQLEYKDNSLEAAKYDHGKELDAYKAKLLEAERRLQQIENQY